MSHFTVLVIGQDPEKQLQPFHEFECTGTVDEYVQSVNKTEEARDDFDSTTRSMVMVPAGVVMAPDTYSLTTHPVHGTLVSKYADCFYVKDPAAGPFDSKKFQLPEGYEVIEVPASELESFAEYAAENYGAPIIAEGVEPDLEDEHKWGWTRVNAAGEVLEVIDRTNPNKKWDWYVLGGRWAGFFKMKPNVRGIQGRPGLMTPAAGEGTADSAFKMDIDFDGMRAEARAEAEQEYDRFEAAVKDCPKAQTWTEVRQAHERNIDAARDAYNAQSAIIALKEAGIDPWGCAIEQYGYDRAAYITRSEAGRLGTYAILKDGEWIARGEMGWFGFSDDHMTKDEWDKRYLELLESLPDDTLLSVYDCHI